MELLVERAVHDKQMAGAELAEALGQGLGLDFRDGRRTQHDQLGGPRLGGQRMAQSRRANLLRKIEFMASHHRSHGLAAADKERRRARAVAGRTGALLAIDLLGRAVHFAAGLGLVRSGAALGELPDDDALDQIGAGLQAKNVVLEIDFARIGGIEGEHFGFHCALSAVAAFSAFLIEPGLGTSLCGRFTASRTITQPPLEPGTAPRTMMRPRSTSTFATSTFCVVMRSTP